MQACSDDLVHTGRAQQLSISLCMPSIGSPRQDHGPSSCTTTVSEVIVPLGVCVVGWVLRRGVRRVLYGCRSLADLIERVLPIASVGPDLAGPAAQFDCLGPCRADQHVRPLDLVAGAVSWPCVRDLLLDTADAHGEGFALDASDGVDAGDCKQIGNMLGVIDFIE